MFPLPGPISRGHRQGSDGYLGTKIVTQLRTDLSSVRGYVTTFRPLLVEAVGVSVPVFVVAVFTEMFELFFSLLPRGYLCEATFDEDRVRFVLCSTPVTGFSFHRPLLY